MKTKSIPADSSPLSLLKFAKVSATDCQKKNLRSTVLERLKVFFKLRPAQLQSEDYCGSKRKRLNVKRLQHTPESFQHVKHMTHFWYLP